MPRSARIFQRALCYHVMNRGVNRQRIFQNDEDRRYFTQTVADAISSAIPFARDWQAVPGITAGQALPVT